MVVGKMLVRPYDVVDGGGVVVGRSSWWCGAVREGCNCVAGYRLFQVVCGEIK